MENRRFQALLQLRYDANFCQSRPYNNQGYLQNGASSLQPGTAPLLPNHGRVIQTGPIRVLCIADVRAKGSPPDLETFSGAANERKHGC